MSYFKIKILAVINNHDIAKSGKGIEFRKANTFIRIYDIPRNLFGWLW
ncbi:hypothetical protein NUBL7079_32330 [Klebsiella pneumoniae]|nr:hypothetical protein KPTHUN262_27220 [Klebsiella pneumoniae]GKI36517.1 hypothetical protein NUBL21973_26230 [Klebsiella pneumoniae]GKJ32176.1 hypothetical protein NUBL7079_32330 [Klebsiella pneumoniae]GKL51569.1 hypothetical protein NUBL21992_47110 [Klebsiella pneumoniae]GKM55328.1 hypothetical protein NUBL13939_39470 [Klebsiella pneumoniae]